MSIFTPVITQRNTTEPLLIPKPPGSQRQVIVLEDSLFFIPSAESPVGDKKTLAGRVSSDRTTLDRTPSSEPPAKPEDADWDQFFDIEAPIQTSPIPISGASVREESARKASNDSLKKSNSSEEGFMFKMDSF